ncbi:PaaI family thioesterase [Prevotella sp. tf2-5]|jgi:acyl-CoA thioesterase|uniref:PaaI family thioesterase n=1 Tax=Prevotella sp. tf2-5 TaxID=1761889 RepID=UPI0008E590DD|nr:hotdog fold thioesterase [Prevotella sp. tf2-5]SFO51063.1 acyl-CoA thioesterase [Prevotella sp. tf2-5]
MNIQQFLNTNDHFAAAAGCRIIEIGEGRAVATMLVTREHLNAGGVCQGGAFFTLADLALAAVMNSRGQLTFGIQNNIMYLASAHEGDVLTAEAIEIANHHKIPSVEVRITNQEGMLLCHVTGLAYRKHNPLIIEEK